MITVTKHEFREQIREILLKLVEEGEPIEITDNGEVIARVVPIREPKQPIKQGKSDAWANLERIATEMAPCLAQA